MSAVGQSAALNEADGSDGARGGRSLGPPQRVGALFSVVVLVLAFSVIAFTSMYGRPSADEYLLGAVSTGYLPDQPEVPLFRLTGDFVRDYVAGVNSFVRLGWDSYPNAAVFQMLPAVGVRYFGAVASQLQGLLNGVAFLLLFYVIVAGGLRVKQRCIAGTALAFLGLVVAITTSNFGTYLYGFGLFPLTGVRYSLYLLFSLSLVGLIVWSCRVINSGPRGYLWFLAGAAGFSALVSQWFVMYWVVAAFITLVLVTSMSSFRSARNVIGLLVVLITSGASAALANDFFRGLLGRTAVGASSGSSLVAGVLTPAVTRSVNQETLSLVFGPSLVVGVVVGAALYLIHGARREKPRASTLLFTLVLFLLTLLLPLIFSVQEAMTYEAYWHRTMPISISFISWMATSYFVVATVASRPLWFSRRGASGLAVMCVVAGAFWVALVADRVEASFRTLQSFSMAWDGGNLLGRGSPIENVYEWNVRDLQRVEANPGSGWPKPFCVKVMFGPREQCPADR